MEHSFEVKGGDLLVTVTNSKEETQKIYQEAIEASAAQITVKGFRKGKAPLSIASRLIDPNALNDRFTRTLIDRDFRSYVKDDALLAVLEEQVPQGVVPSVELPEPRDGSTVVFVYPVRPQVTKLGAYEKLKTEVKAHEVTDADVDAELNRLAQDQADLAPVTDAAADGNYVNCDIKGTINGIEVPSLSEKALDIVVGAKRFIPGFEEKLIGHKTGDDFQVEVDLPDNYPADIANKHAVFAVHVNSVKKKEVPAIDDNLATVQDTYPEAKDLADLKAKIKAGLTEKAQKAYKDQKFSAVISQVIASTEFAIDEPRLKASLVENQRKSDEATLSQQGLDLETYLRLVKMDAQTYANNVYANLLRQLKANAVEKAIYAAAKLPEVTEEEIAKFLGDNGVKDVEGYKKGLASNYLAHNKKATQAEADLFVKERLSPVVEQLKLNRLSEFVLANND